MSLANFAKSYKNVAITTAPPGQLVLMLFDGALRFMATAVKGFDEPNIATKNEQIHNNLIKAQNILAELQRSLDMTVGGEFPQTMFRLYDYMIAQLQEANIRKNPEPIHIVEGLLSEIRNAWSEMLQKSGAGPGASPGTLGSQSA